MSTDYWALLLPTAVKPRLRVKTAERISAGVSRVVVSLIPGVGNRMRCSADGTRKDTEPLNTSCRTGVQWHGAIHPVAVKETRILKVKT